VYDPLSARAAEAIGYEMMMLAGSIASAVVLGAPDLVLLTLSELAEQARRITRAAHLPLLVDADHGYGNALNAMRCVQELEAAGVAALTIEDTALPRPFDASGEALVSIAEGVAKVEAALAARSRPETVILARTSALRIEGLDGCLRRVAAYSAIAADGIFLVGARSRAEIEALRRVTSLPFVLGTAAAELQDRAYLASQGVKVLLLGHAPFQAATAAMYETLAALRNGVLSADAGGRQSSPSLVAELTAESHFASLTKRYLHEDSDA